MNEQVVYQINVEGAYYLQRLGKYVFYLDEFRPERQFERIVVYAMGGELLYRVYGTVSDGSTMDGNRIAYCQAKYE